MNDAVSAILRARQPEYSDFTIKPSEKGNGFVVSLALLKPKIVYKSSHAAALAIPRGTGNFLSGYVPVAYQSLVVEKHGLRSLARQLSEDPLTATGEDAKLLKRAQEALQEAEATLELKTTSDTNVPNTKRRFPKLIHRLFQRKQPVVKTQAEPDVFFVNYADPVLLPDDQFRDLMARGPSAQLEVYRAGG